MKQEETNGNRTHEPSLRELTAELDGLRELFLAKHDALKEIIDERDRFYKERDVATKEQTKASFDASEKAIVKAEDSQKEYNVRSNEFRGQLDDQAKLLMSRQEALGMFKAMDDKLGGVKGELERRFESAGKDIQGLRESRSVGEGHSGGSHAAWGYVLAAISVVGSLLAMGTILLKFGTPR